MQTHLTRRDSLSDDDQRVLMATFDTFPGDWWVVFATSRRGVMTAAISPPWSRLVWRPSNCVIGRSRRGDPCVTFNIGRTAYAEFSDIAEAPAFIRERFDVMFGRHGFMAVYDLPVLPPG